MINLKNRKRQEIKAWWKQRQIKPNPAKKYKVKSANGQPEKRQKTSENQGIVEAATDKAKPSKQQNRAGKLFTVVQAKETLGPSKQHKPQKKRSWSDEERAAVDRHLGTHIEKNRLPGKMEIERCIRSESALKERTWKNVKDFCRNLMTSKNRKKAFSGMLL